MREFRTGGQPDAARHRHQHVTDISIQDRQAERRIALRAHMHMIAAFHAHRHGIAHRPQQVRRPGAQSHHAIARRDRARFRLDRPAITLFGER